MIKKFRLPIVLLLSCVISVIFIKFLKLDCTEINAKNTVAAQAGGSDKEMSDESSFDPADVFRSARLAYNDQMVVAASMSEEILLYGQHIIGVGDYLEKIDNGKRYLRMEMNYSCDNVRHSIQYISDAAMDVFWISNNMGSRNELYRIDAFKLNAQTADPELVASIDGVPITPVSFAGIPYILFQIEKYYSFSSCVMIQDVQSNESKNEIKQYYVVTGTWKPERFPIQNLVSDNVIKWDSVPPEIPDTVKIFFGVNNLFPYKIHYYRKDKEQSTLISKLNFYNVSFDVRLNPKQFGFSPSNANHTPIDITDHYLKKKDKPIEKTPINN